MARLTPADDGPRCGDDPDELSRDEVLLGVAHPRERAFTLSEIRGRIVYKHPGLVDDDVRRLVEQLHTRGLVEHRETPEGYAITLAGWRHLRSRRGDRA